MRCSSRGVPLTMWKGSALHLITDSLRLIGVLMSPCSHDVILKPEVEESPKRDPSPRSLRFGGQDDQKKLRAKLSIMKNNKPLISILMPVYNAGEYLVEAVESILTQTYQNFEFIIIDDASTDNSWDILTTMAKKHKKIRLFRNTTNQGISETTNRAISYAQGDYLARMDADDISLPNRLEKQLSYMKKHADVVALGTQCMLIDKKNNLIGEKTFPFSAKDVYDYIYRFIPVQHPTLMIARNRLPEDFSFYDQDEKTAEDVQLLFKLFQYGKVENLPDYLFAYRLHGKNNSLRQLKRTFYLTLRSRIQAVFSYGYRPTVTGVLMTLIQTLLVSLFPEIVLTKMYLVMKGIKTADYRYFMTTLPRLIQLPLFHLSLLLTLNSA